MKRSAFIIAAVLVFSACKKDEEPAPAPAPQTVQKGTASIAIEAWDSMGIRQNNVPDVKVLVQNNIYMVASSVTVQYTNDYGDYFPSLVKDHYEGAPLKFTINAPSMNVTIPLAQRSGFRTQNLSAQIIRPDSVLVNFNLDRAIPAGTQAKLALIAGGGGLSASNYESTDIFFTNTSSGNKVNIAKFARFKNYLATLDSNATFYVNVIPVSYGEYVSNVVPKPMLLGDNPIAPDNWLLKKDWKK